MANFKIKSSELGKQQRIINLNSKTSRAKCLLHVSSKDKKRKETASEKKKQRSKDKNNKKKVYFIAFKRAK